MTMDAETVFIDTNILVYATDKKSDLQTKSIEMLPWLNITLLTNLAYPAAKVLAARDVEKNILDRAVWGDDERMWSRQGRLPQPGWRKEKPGGVNEIGRK